MIRTIRSVALIAVAVAACDSITQSEIRWELQPGVVDFYEEPIVIEYPDTVLAGDPFVVTVRTYGGGCVQRGPTQVAVAGPTATVEPLDSVVTSNGEDFACTDELRLFDHHAAVAFDQTGSATIVVVGASQPEGQPFTTERTVVVR